MILTKLGIWKKLVGDDYVSCTLIFGDVFFNIDNLDPNDLKISPEYNCTTLSVVFRDSLSKW